MHPVLTSLFDRNFIILSTWLYNLFRRAMVKLKQSVSVKTINESLKYQYPLQWAFKSAIFYAITGYGPKQLLSRCHRS